MASTQVAIVGFGRFGRLLAGLLREYCGDEVALVVTSRTDHAEDAASLGLSWAGIKQAAARADVLMLCVPIGELRGALDGIKGIVRPGTLVVDTCSVKVYPAAEMADRLPAQVALLATHPLFGPDGVRDFGIAGQRLVSCPIRVPYEQLDVVEGWFKRMGVGIMRMTPEEHDRQAAISQALVHFIGRAIAQAGFVEPDVTTNNAARLFALARSVEADSRGLFHDLESLNPFAAEIRQRFLAALDEIEATLTPG